LRHNKRASTLHKQIRHNTPEQIYKEKQALNIN